MFLLKKLLSILLTPFPMLVAALGAGLGILLLTRRVALGRWITVGALAGLLVGSCDPIADVALETLEDDYPPLFTGRPGAPDAEARAAKHVVVLGAGYVADMRVPETSRINATGIARIVEAIRVQRQTREARLVLSGSNPYGTPYARIAGSFALSVGVPRDSIVEVGSALDTEGEAVALRRTVGDAPFVLVTSAAHMWRAMALMKKQGLRPIAAPADFWTTDAPGANAWDLLPSPRAFEKWDRAVHEYVGYLWSALRGRI